MHKQAASTNWKLKQVTKERILVQNASCLPIAHAALFSSIAALTGPAGSANYAAANATLDAAASKHSMQGRTPCLLPHAIYILPMHDIPVSIHRPVSSEEIASGWLC